MTFVALLHLHGHGSGGLLTSMIRTWPWCSECQCVLRDGEAA